MTTDLKKIFGEIQGFRCHICTELFSTDCASKLAPARVTCGHYVCMECHRKLRTNKNSNCWHYVCCLCMKEMEDSTRGLSPAYGYIEFISNIRTVVTELGMKAAEQEKISLHDFLLAFTGMRCQVCRCLFSTDVHELNPPTTSWCGHFWCHSCDVKRRERRKDGNKTRFYLECPKCQFAFYTTKLKRPSYGFMSTLTELTEYLKQYWLQKFRFIYCSQCKDQISVDKAGVCVSCFMGDNDKERDRDQMSALCFPCGITFHQGPDHKLEIFTRLKNEQKEFASKTTLDSLLTALDNIVTNHSDFAKIVKDLKKNLEMAFTYVEANGSSSNCLAIALYLSSEMEKLRKEIEEYTTPAQHFNSQLCEIDKRLNEILGTIEAQKNN